MGYLKKPYKLSYRQKRKISYILNSLNIRIETRKELLNLKNQIQCLND